MPAKGTSKLTEFQRARIAAARANGKTHKEAAVAAGCSPMSSYRLSREDRTQSLSIDLATQHEAKIRSTFGAAIDRIEAMVKTGTDEKMVLRAIDRLLTIVEARDRTVMAHERGNAPQEDGVFLLDELLLMRRTLRVSAA